MKFTVIIIFILLLTNRVPGQSDSVSSIPDTIFRNSYFLQPVERNGISLPEINIREVVIIGRAESAKKFPFWKYQRLVYNLKKVYPYALVVRSRLDEINKELAGFTDEKDRKKYIRQVEKDIFGEYEDDVRDMTITQGKLLIKLIDRETLNTSYTLIREYRGAFSAAFWQSVARLFGTNLKEEYDPYGQDIIMEIILQEIEAGKL